MTCCETKCEYGKKMCVPRGKTLQRDSMLPCICSVVKLQGAKCASEAPWVRRIDNPSRRANLVVTSPSEPSFVCTDSWEGGKGSQHKPISYAIESCQHSHFIFFVSHFLLPSPDRNVFRKHKKKEKVWPLRDILGVLNLYVIIPLEVTLTSKLG